MSDKKQLPAEKPAAGQFPPQALRALREGRVADLVKAFRDTDPDTSEAKLAGLAIELRRENVAVLGSHEAFVRMTPDGSLHQVVRPVRLSIDEGTIYKIPKWAKDDNGNWKKTWPLVAHVTYPGFMRQNAVAACNIGQPPSVVVDGEVKTNPYVHRAPTPDGRLGDIVRVVIAVLVVGPAPMTGNPVVVAYTLDYDPAKDLLHSIAKVAEDAPGECYLIDEEELKVMTANHDRKAGWKFLPLYGGVGYYFNLGNKKILACFKDYIGTVQNSVKKAQTVARRNAMKSHPAFVSTAIPDDNGHATLPVIGWAGDSSTMKRWQDIQERLARGLDLGLDGAEEIVIDAEYEPEQEEEAAPPKAAQAAEQEAEPEHDSKRSALIIQIDQGLALISADDASELHYDPDNNTEEELRAVLSKINAMVDSDAGSEA